MSPDTKSIILTLFNWAATLFCGYMIGELVASSRFRKQLSEIKEQVEGLARKAMRQEQKIVRARFSEELQRNRLN